MTPRDLDQDNELFEGKLSEDIVFVSFKEISLLWLSNLKSKEKLLSYFHQIERVPSIKTVILYEVHSPQRQEDYFDFYSLFTKSRIDSDEIFRMCNALDQIMLGIIESTKFFILAQSGRIILPFFTSGFACDYRIVGDNFIVQNPMPKIGLFPKGAGAFFLTRIVGSAKAEEILLSDNDMDAYQLSQLKLVDKIVPFGQLRDAALETAGTFSGKSVSSLIGVKKLVNYSLRDLKSYLEFENKQLLQILHTLKKEHE